MVFQHLMGLVEETALKSARATRYTALSNPPFISLTAWHGQLTLTTLFLVCYSMSAHLWAFFLPFAGYHKRLPAWPSPVDLSDEAEGSQKAADVGCVLCLGSRYETAQGKMAVSWLIPLTILCVALCRGKLLIAALRRVCISILDMVNDDWLIANRNTQVSLRAVRPVISVNIRGKPFSDWYQLGWLLDHF